MSRTIDERVVEMRFDNKHFESNVATSMSTLEKLKRSLKLDGATKGLEDIDRAAKRVDMSGLGGAVETVRAKFSALDVVAVTALANITNSAVNAGKQMLKSLSIDQLSAGWQKFSDKTTSVATLQAQGYALEEVNEQLDRLNWFTDETSYNLTDMISNISKFTATGKGLTESVTAMEGIATWAALSGQNAQKASSAMYQLSQALGAGYMRREDWRSIQNVSMDTDEFRQKTLEAAVALKTLKDNGDGTYTSLINNSKEATNFTKTQFVESLTSGAWFTSDVMMKVFNEYSSAVNSIYEITEEKGMLASEVIDEIRDKAKQLKTDGMTDAEATDEAIRALGYTLEDGSLKFDSFGLKAFEAGQKARTFQDAIDSVKDAVSTGWMKTYELIFGDAEKATELWTDLANTLWDVFAAGGEVRNTILEFGLNFAKPWKEIKNKLIEQASLTGLTEDEISLFRALEKEAKRLGISIRDLAKEMSANDGRTLLIDSFRNAVNGLLDIGQIIRNAFNEIFNPPGVGEMAVKIYGITKSLNEFSKKLRFIDDETGKLNATGEKIKRTFEGVFAVFDIIAEVLGGAFKAGLEIVRYLLGSTDKSILDVTASIGDVLVSVRNWIKENNRIKKTFDNIVKAAKKVIDAVNDWVTAFKEIPVVKDVLEEIKDIFEYISGESDSLGGSAKAVADWIDSFDGLDFITSAFELLSSAIKASIGIIGQWISAFKEFESVKQFTEAIANLAAGIRDLFNGDIDTFEFARTLGRSLAKILTSLPKMAIEFGEYFIQGFLEGITGSLGNLINGIIDFCGQFCSAFAGALDEHSPSKISYGYGVNWVQGFIDGITSMLGPLIAAMDPIIEAVKMIFSSFWKYITDENGDLKWDKIITGGITIESLIILKQFADSFEKIANSFTSFSSIFSNVGKVLKSFSKVLDGISWDFKAQALLKLAISIGILVAAIWALTQIDDIGKLWNAVGVIAVLAVIIAGLAWAMNLLSSASLKWDKGPQFEGVKSGLLQIGIALLLVAAVVKIIGDMDPDQAKQGFKGLAGLAAGMIVFLAIMGGISRYSEDVSGMGRMMLKLSFALTLMVAACKLIGLLTLEDIGKGILFVGAFTFFIMALTAVSSVANSEISKIGSMAIKLSFAMALLVGVCKLVGMLSPDEMFKGAIFAAAFVGFVWALVAVTKMGYQEHVESVGALVLGVSLSLLAMVGVCKIAGQLTWKEIAKGIVAVGAMTGLIIAMVAILKVGDAQDLTKVGGTIIAMSTAIMIMAGTAVILGMVPTKDLAKGIAAVSVLGIIMALMVHGLKGAAAVKGEIIAMTACLVLVAGCIVILTRVADKDKLESASAAMIAVMATLSFMVRSLKGLEKGKISTGSVYALMGVVLILAGIIALLSYAIKDPMSAVGAATSLGVLLMALSTSLVIMSKAGRISKTVTDQLASMIGVIMGLALILGMLAQFPNADVMIPNAIALGILVNAMASSMFLMGKAGRISKTVSDQFASMIGVIMGMALILGMLAQFPNAEVMIPNAIALGVLMNAMASALFIMGKAGRISKTVTDQLMTMTLAIGGLAVILGVLSLFPNAEVMIPNAIALGILVNALSAAMVILGFAGPNAAKAVPAAMMMGLVLGGIALVLAVLSLLDVTPSLETALALSTLLLALSAACAIVSFIPSAAAIDGALGLAAFIGIMAGVVAIAGGLSKIPGFNELLADGGDTLALVGSAIGKFIGSIVGGIAIGVASSLPVIGVALSEFMVGAEPFIKMASTVGSEVIQGAGYIAGAILALSSAGFISGLMSLMSLGQASLPAIGLQLMIFGKCAKEFGDSISGIDASSVEAATSISNMLLALTTSEFLSTITEWFGGSVDFSSLGANLKAFGDAVVEFSNQISGKIDSSAVEAAASAGMLLVELNKALPRSGGLLQDFIGEKDFKAFAEACNSFVKCIIDIDTVVGEEDFTMHEETIEKIVKAGTAFSELNNAIPRSGGFVQDFIGEEDLATFGESCVAFVECIKSINDVVSQEGFAVNLEVFESMKQAGIKLNELQTALPKSGGWWQDVAGSSDIGEFGEKIGKFASVIVDFSNSSSGLNNEGISLAIDTAERIRDLIISLSDFDMSGLPKFIGAGSDGAVQKVAKAITEYSNEVAGINTEAVSVSVSAARDIKSLINTLPSLDTSGIANFKPDLVGVAIKSYADKVTGINWSEVASSTASAKNLRILIDSLSGIDTTGVSSFKAAVDELATVNVAGVVAAFSGASEQMASAGTSMINSLVSGMRSGIPSITTLVSDILNYSSSYIRSSTNKFILAGSTLAESIAKGVESKKNRIIMATSSCTSGAATAIRGKYSEFVNAGSYLVEGFANGISANSFKAVATARAMAEAAISAAREALKINSPSKVFKAIGSGVPEGFAIGIGMLGGEVKRSVTDMASTAIKSTRSAMSNILEAVSGDVDAQPTIRPVIDLTDVRSGANTIDSLFSDVQTVGVRSNLSAISSSMNSRGQNGTNNDIISAINKLNDGLSSNRGDVYNFGDFTYDDGSNISDAVQTLVRAARVGRRV